MHTKTFTAFFALAGAAASNTPGQSILIPNSQGSAWNGSIPGGSTFTGDVLVDGILRDGDDGAAIVNFPPGSRSFWHHHEGWQTIYVLAGSGFVMDRGGKAKRIHAGDTVWCEPNTTHWHGADESHYLIHLAVAHGGHTEWLEEVTVEDYAKANRH